MSGFQNIAKFDFTSILIGILIFFIVFLFKSLVKKCQRDPRLMKFAETLPGPPVLPLLGNSLDLFSKEDFMKRLIDYREKYGNIYRLWLGKQLFVGLSGVEDLEVVFTNSKFLDKGEVFKPFHDFWGDSLFTGPLHIWKKSRKRHTPSFANNRIISYISHFNDRIYRLVDDIKKKADGPEFEAGNTLFPVAFDIVTKTFFNMELPQNDESRNEFDEDQLRATQIVSAKLRLPWLHDKFINYLVYKKEIMKIQKNGIEFAKKIVRDKMNEIYEETQPASNGEIPVKSFLTTAYELSKEMNDEKLLYDEIVDIMSAGSDTISTATSFSLLALAIHQDIQDKLYDELYEVFGESDRRADNEDLKRLPYLDQVMKEVLRRFTVVPFIVRDIMEDTKLGNHILPAGSVILVSIGAVHFDPVHYPDPWKFNPENFSLDAIQKRHKLAYLPFGAGPRNCIAQGYAMQEMKLILVALLRNFTFHTTMKTEDIKLKFQFSMTSINGFNVSVKLRTKTPSYFKNK